MAIFDFFKLEKIENEDMSKLKTELEAMQKKQEEEKEKLQKELLAEKERFAKLLEDEKSKYAEIEKTSQEMRQSFESEKLATKKEMAVITKLSQEGANPKLINLFKKEIKLDEVEFSENGELANWDKVTEPIKSQYSEFFTGAETVGVDKVTPPENKKIEKDPFLDGFESEL